MAGGLGNTHPGQQADRGYTRVHSVQTWVRDYLQGRSQRLTGCWDHKRLRLGLYHTCKLCATTDSIRTVPFPHFHEGQESHHHKPPQHL